MRLQVHSPHAVRQHPSQRASCPTPAHQHSPKLPAKCAQGTHCSPAQLQLTLMHFLAIFFACPCACPCGLHLGRCRMLACMCTPCSLYVNIPVPVLVGHLWVLCQPQHTSTALSCQPMCPQHTVVGNPVLSAYARSAPTAAQHKGCCRMLACMCAPCSLYVDTPVPVFVGHLRVLCQLPFDHQCLDVVDGVHVVDAVLHHSPHRLEAFVGPHGRHSVTCRTAARQPCRQTQTQKASTFTATPFSYASRGPILLSPKAPCYGRHQEALLCKSGSGTSTRRCPCMRLSHAQLKRAACRQHTCRPGSTIRHEYLGSSMPQLRSGVRTLHQNVAVCQQLQSLECAAVGPNQALPPLDKLLLVPQHAANLDDVTLHVILQDLQRLRCNQWGMVNSSSGRDQR